VIRPRVLAIGITILTAFACEKPFTPPPPAPVPPPPPTEPRLTLQLATPHDDDGAIVLEIHGLYAREPRNLVTANWMLADGLDSMTVRVVVIGEITGGQLLDFGFPEGAAPAAYSARVTEAADRQGIPRANVLDYRLTITQ